MLMSSNYSNMGNKNKTVIHMHKLSVRQYLFLLNTSFQFKNSTDLLKMFTGDFQNNILEKNLYFAILCCCSLNVGDCRLKMFSCLDFMFENKRETLKLSKWVSNTINCNLLIYWEWSIWDICSSAWNLNKNQCKYIKQITYYKYN